MVCEVLIPVNQLIPKVAVDKHVDKSRNARFFLYGIYHCMRKTYSFALEVFRLAARRCLMASAGLVDSEFVSLRTFTVVFVAEFLQFSRC